MWSRRSLSSRKKIPHKPSTTSYKPSVADVILVGLLVDEDDVVQVLDGPTTRTRDKAFQEALVGFVQRILAQSYTWRSSGDAVDFCRSLLRVREEEQRDQAPGGIEQAPNQLPIFKPRVSVPAGRPTGPNRRPTALEQVPDRSFRAPTVE
ncbi:hypothetical protein Dimus_013809 [Dionaea muscipula]